MATTVEARRTPGRPRDPKLDAAILEATLQLLASDGYEGLTIEAVAAMAGVGKASVYRRFAGKEQLVVEAVASLSEQPERRKGMGVRDELVTLLETIRRKNERSLAGKIFLRLLSAGIENPMLLQRYREQVLDPRRQRFVDVVQRGVDEGVIRADVDPWHAVDLIVGPMVYRNLIRTDPAPGPDLAASIVDDVLVALAPSKAPVQKDRA